MLKIIQQKLVEQIKESTVFKETFQKSIQKLKFKLKELMKELKDTMRQFFKCNVGNKSYIRKLKNLCIFHKRELRRLRYEYYRRFGKITNKKSAYKPFKIKILKSHKFTLIKKNFSFMGEFYQHKFKNRIEKKIKDSLDLLKSAQAKLYSQIFLNEILKRGFLFYLRC